MLRVVQIQGGLCVDARLLFTAARTSRLWNVCPLDDRLPLVIVGVDRLLKRLARQARRRHRQRPQLFDDRRFIGYCDQFIS